MSKRPKHNRKNGSREDHFLSDEPALAVNTQAFQAFEARIDEALKTLVARWAHAATPLSSTVRRVVPMSTRRHSDQP